MFGILVPWRRLLATSLAVLFKSLSENLEDEFITYQNLMKEATRYKKDNIDKSISLIRKAIEVCPSCARFEGNFRLVKYLTLAKKHDEVKKEYGGSKNLLESSILL